MAGRKAAAVTPNDDVDLTNVTSSIYVGVGGDVALILANDGDGDPVTFKGLAAGQTMFVQVRRVMANGTTATDIVAVWG